MSGQPDLRHPPSDPRPLIARGGIVSRAAQDRSLRTQFAMALVVGIVLVGSGLYLWRRPRAPAEAQTAEAAASAAFKGDEVVSSVSTPTPTGLAPISLSDARVLACQDPGPKRTPADQCDRLATIEKALANAVEQSSACVPDSLSGNTIEYVADVSFSRRKVSVLLPRAGRSLHDRKVLAACATAVRDALVTIALEGIDHHHARYKIALTATYKHANKG
jgi:hypothetical protein